LVSLIGIIIIIAFVINIVINIISNTVSKICTILVAFFRFYSLRGNSFYNFMRIKICQLQFTRIISYIAVYKHTRIVVTIYAQTCCCTYNIRLPWSWPELLPVAIIGNCHLYGYYIRIWHHYAAVGLLHGSICIDV
jgi:hypothetical protein